MPDIDQTKNPAENIRGRPGEDDEETLDAAEPIDDVYDPSTVEVNRGREQGLGVGQKDLDQQRDPTRIASAEQYGREPDDAGKTPDKNRRDH